MVYFQPMTAAGYQEIQEEMARLKKERPTRIKRLQQARSMGDLSENTEYTEAKRELGHLNSRLHYLGKQLKYARIVEPSQDGTVSLGRQVTVSFSPDDEQTYQIVGRLQAAPEDGRLAFDSQLGQALLGKKTGDRVHVSAPGGSYEVIIKAVF